MKKKYGRRLLFAGKEQLSLFKMNLLPMRHAIPLLILFLFLISCRNKTGTVNGRLCYPSDFIPELNVYLKEKNTGKIYKQTTQIDQEYFQFLNIPYGEYCAYSYTVENMSEDQNGIEEKVSAAYTKAVPCGLSVDCNDHSIIYFKVDQQLPKDTIAICDYYGAVVPPEEL